MLLKFIASLVIFVALSLFVGRWLMNKAAGDRREPTQQEAAAIAAQQGPQVRAATNTPAPTQPIELKVSTAPWWEDLKWVIGLWFGAMVLYGDPQVLWTRWLAWPLATLMLLGSAIPAFSAWAEWRSGLTASASGLEFRDGTGFLKQVGWSQVGGVKLMAYYGRRATRQGLNAPTTLVLERETFLVLDKAGQTLLEVAAPLRPETAFVQLLDSVPAWAGVPVVQERSESR